MPLKKKFKELLIGIVNQIPGIRSRIETVCDTVVGMIVYQAVNHKKMGLGVESPIKPESAVRKIERLFSSVHLMATDVGPLVYRMIKNNMKFTVIIDRTNWDFGTKHINVFVAAIVFQGFAIPIVWKILLKKGGSNTDERIDLMEKVIKIVGLNNIEVLLGDREFIGDVWLQMLDSKKVPYAIRLRENLYVTWEGNKISIKNLFRTLCKGETREYEVTLGKTPARLAATRSKKGELVVVAASTYYTEDLLTKYKKRWLIELFFKSIKTKGFNFEDTHMTDPAKIETLMGFIALATVLIVKAGHAKNLLDPISIKNHGRKVYSLFTYGLDFIKSIFVRKVRPEDRKRILNLLYEVFTPTIEKCPNLEANNVGY